MPIWGAFFLLRLHRAKFIWADFARHGEFGIYAAAFLAPSIYHILKSMRKDRFPLKAGSVLLALFGILMAAFIYAGTNPQFGANVPQLGSIDEVYLMRFSATLLSLAFIFSFFVVLMDTVINDPDVGYADKVDQAFLRAEVSVDHPISVPDIADATAPPAQNAIASNDELRSQFNAERAEGEDTHG